MLCSSDYLQIVFPQCNATYCGETIRHIETNFTSYGLFRPELVFHVLDHVLATCHEIAQNNFQIVLRPKTTIIKVVESVVIHQQKPAFNNMESSIPLKTLFYLSSCF